MDFEDRRVGPEERFSGLSEGQRYALALVLNLAFVGVVIAGFAFLYTGGFGGREAPVAPSASPAAIEEPDEEPAPVRLAAADPESAGLGLSLPEESSSVSGIETAELDPATLARIEPLTGAPTATDGAGGPDLGAVEEDAGSDASEPEGDDAETLTLAALEAAPPALPEPDAVETEAAVDEVLDETSSNPAVVAALGPEPRLAPRVATTDASPSPEIDPVGSLWSTAGSLAANLQRDFPCSQFSLQADNAGRPSLRARVGFSDDLDLVRARVEDGFDDASDVEGGLGCTTVIGGGYVALSDENGQVALFGGQGLTREIRAVLPTEGACALIGQVVATQPALRQRLASAGQEATWVRSGGEPALCEGTEDGMWQVVSGRNAGDRQAAALVLGDDVLATEARRAASTAPAAAEPAAPSTVAAAGSQTPPSVAAAPTTSADGLTEVAPVDGPSPQAPAGVPPSADGYAVAVAFQVDEAGRPADLSVIGAGLAPVSVVAAALDNVSASRFPATGSAYRASYTVRFPSAEFMDLLSRLTLATATERNAEPLWDRNLSQGDYDRNYPDRALRRNINGEVAVDCQIAFDGRLTCAVSRETPSGWGFGSAALSLAEIMRASPRMSDGGPSANETVQLEFVFNSSGVQ